MYDLVIGILKSRRSLGEKLKSAKRRAKSVLCNHWLTRTMMMKREHFHSSEREYYEREKITCI